jgi:ribosomal protein L7/L12
LLVRSIGTADAAVIPSLRPLRCATDVELAALLYRAPSELLANVDREIGSNLAAVLRGAGVDVELVPAGEEFAAGVGDLEIAIAVKRFDQLLAIVETTMRALGTDIESARRMVCSSPAVLLGGVSLATAEALEKRFAPLGAELDVSRAAFAAFDIATEGGGDVITRMLADLLPGAVSVKAPGAGGQFFATGLSSEAARKLWSELSRTAAKAHILNRDFHRFDVKLEAAPRTPAMIELLRSTTGMAENTAVRALGRLPFVLAENVRGPRMLELLDQVHARNGRATGTLLALLRFGLVLSPGGDRAAARPWVEAIAGPTSAQEFDRPDCNALRGPLTKTEARWLQHELRKYGVSSRLVER